MDHILRTELAEQCGVPLIENSKVKEDFYIKAIRSSARALLKDKMLQKIPAERKAELKQVLINHFKKGNFLRGVDNCGLNCGTSVTIMCRNDELSWLFTNRIPATR